MDYLLRQGAEAEISFESFKRSSPSTHTNSSRYRWNMPYNETMFKVKITQPSFVAAKWKLPDIVNELLDLKVEVNSIDKDGQHLVSNHESSRRGSSVLDAVLATVAKLKIAKLETKVDFPEPLKSDDLYLAGLEPGSYRFWKATHDLKYAKEQYSGDQMGAREERKNINSTGAKEEKQSLVRSLLDKYKSPEARARGARHSKTFIRTFLSLESTRTISAMGPTVTMSLTRHVSHSIEVMGSLPMVMANMLCFLRQHGLVISALSRK